MEACGQLLLDTKKNFTKTKVQTKLVWFLSFEISRSLEGIAKLGTIWEQLAWQMFNSFFNEKSSVTNLECELRGNNKFCGVLGIIMPQMKRFKNRRRVSNT